MNLSDIQAALRDGGHEAWLFYDHHHRDPIAYRVLGLPADRLTTRRWFYLIPANGEPVKLVHRIESHHLDSLPGRKIGVFGVGRAVGQTWKRWSSPTASWSCSIRRTTRFLTSRWLTPECWSWCGASEKRSSPRPIWSRGSRPR